MFVYLISNSSHGGTGYTEDEVMFVNFTFSSEFPRKMNENVGKFVSSSVRSV